MIFDRPFPLLFGEIWLTRYISPICGEFVDRIRVVLGGKLSNRFITRGKSCLRSGSPMVNRIIVKLIGDSKEKDLFLLITS